MALLSRWNFGMWKRPDEQTIEQYKFLGTFRPSWTFSKEDANVELGLDIIDITNPDGA